MGQIRGRTHQLCTMQTLPLPEHVLHFRPVVLTVDDADNMRDALRVVLEGECDVIETQNGAAALDLVRERRVDLVLLDVLMPKKLSSRSRTSSTLFTPRYPMRATFPAGCALSDQRRGKHCSDTDSECPAVHY